MTGFSRAVLHFKNLKCTAMLKKIFATATLLSSVLCVYAQDSSITTKTASTILSGFVDVYYRYNLYNPKKESETFNNYTSFTNSHNSFELGMASVRVDHSFGKASATVDLGFGRRAEEALDSLPAVADRRAEAADRADQQDAGGGGEEAGGRRGGVRGAGGGAREHVEAGGPVGPDAPAGRA